MRPVLSTSITLLIALSAPIATFADSDDAPSGCEDPLAAIMATLECIEKSDAECATKGYDGTRFIKLHNGIDTETTIDDNSDYWTGAFAFSNLGFSYDHKANVGPNQASVRYIETVAFTDGSSFGLPPSETFPWGSMFVQHEHALVTVDDDCKMILWDQYGDVAEQEAVNDASMAMLVALCGIGIFPTTTCATFGIVIEPATASKDESTDANGTGKAGKSMEADYYNEQSMPAKAFKDAKAAKTDGKATKLSKSKSAKGTRK